MAAPSDSALTFRIIRQLRLTLPNDLELEVDRILGEEPGCRKRHILFAIRSIYVDRSQNATAWHRAILEVCKQLEKDDPLHISMQTAVRHDSYSKQARLSHARPQPFALQALQTLFTVPDWVRWQSRNASSGPKAAGQGW